MYQSMRYPFRSKNPATFSGSSTRLVLPALIVQLSTNVDACETRRNRMRSRPIHSLVIAFIGNPSERGTTTMAA
jgi:hypothetical protein